LRELQQLYGDIKATQDRLLSEQAILFQNSFLELGIPPLSPSQVLAKNEKQVSQRFKALQLKDMQRNPKFANSQGAKSKIRKFARCEIQNSQIRKVRNRIRQKAKKRKSEFAKRNEKRKVFRKAK
jgi:hypothetical protein